MSDVIANCACCGGKANLVGVGNHSWWICPNVACGIVGPNNDFDGAKWNALMRPSAAVAADAPDELAALRAGNERLREDLTERRDRVMLLEEVCIRVIEMQNEHIYGHSDTASFVRSALNGRAALAQKEG